jgi:hypothetical protein
VRRQDPDGNWQIEAGSIFLEMRGREVHRDAADGKQIAAVCDGAAHAHFCLADRDLGETDRIERRCADADVDLDLHGDGFDAAKGGCVDRMAVHASRSAVAVPAALGCR